MPSNNDSMSDFKKLVWEFYEKNKRVLPWRNVNNPYEIFISEVMLQQTQVQRVIPKYENWVREFPDFKILSQASLQKVILFWSGLGYNRRAKFLLDSARIISTEWKGAIPQDPELLIQLPGIGKATAASIVVFSYNKPIPFIETNIRRVFIHEFFKESNDISDKQILELVESTIDLNQPRNWYYALMDYGAYLGRTVPNPNRRSKMYTRQSTFEGSPRQVRGEILRILTSGPVLEKVLKKKIKGNTLHFQKALEQLLTESFLEKNGDTIQIKDHE